MTVLWKRKGPKGCYRAVHEGRVYLLEKATVPPGPFWLLYRPDGKGGLTVDTLYGPTNEVAFKTASALLLGEKVEVSQGA